MCVVFYCVCFVVLVVAGYRGHNNGHHGGWVCRGFGLVLVVGTGVCLIGGGVCGWGEVCNLWYMLFVKVLRGNSFLSGVVERETRRGRRLFLSPGTTFTSRSLNEIHRRRRYPVHAYFRQSESEVVRSRTFHELGRGARIFLSPNKSRCEAELARALRISRVTHAVTHTLTLGRSLARTTTLNRSLNRAPFNRTNRHTLERLSKVSFGRCRRDIHITRGVRGRNENLGLATRIGGTVLYRARNRGTFALRKRVVECTSGVTCVGRSVSSTRTTKLVDRRSVPFRLHGTLNFHGSREVGGLILSIISGDNGRVTVDNRARGDFSRLYSFVCSFVCGKAIYGARSSGTYSVVRELCLCCIGGIYRVPRVFIYITGDRNTGETIYSCVTNVDSACTLGGCGRLFVPGFVLS